MNKRNASAAFILIVLIFSTVAAVSVSYLNTSSTERKITASNDKVTLALDTALSGANFYLNQLQQTIPGGNTELAAFLGNSLSFYDITITDPAPANKLTTEGKGKFILNKLTSWKSTESESGADTFDWNDTQGRLNVTGNWHSPDETEEASITIEAYFNVDSRSRSLHITKWEITEPPP